MASMRVCDSLTGPLAVQFDVDAVRSAQAISVFAIAYGLLQMVYGPASDRIGKPRVIVLAVCGCLLGNLLLCFASSMSMVIALRAVSGGFAAGIIPISMAFIGDTVAFEDRQPVLARFLTATLTGMIAGQWLGGVLGDHVGWRMPFALLTGVFALAAWLMLRAGFHRTGKAAAGDASPRPVAFGSQVAGILRERWPRRFLAISLAEGALAVSIFALVPTHLHQRFGLSMSAGGSMLALFGAGGLLYAMTASRLLRRLGEAGLARMGGLLLGAAFMLLALDLHPWMAAPASLLGGLGLYMLHNTLQTHATQLSTRHRGTAVALFASSVFLGQSLGVTGAAAAVSAHLGRWLFAACALATPLLAWLFVAALRGRSGTSALRP